MKSDAAELDLEEHTGLPGDEPFQVDKVSWQPSNRNKTDIFLNRQFTREKLS